MSSSGTRSVLTTLTTLVFAILATGCISRSVSNTNTTPVNPPINTNIDSTIDSDLTLTGRVFVKGYGTPSESYGFLVEDGREIGFGSYDSKREEFRSTIGNTLMVTFSDICRTGEESCCRTLFTYCGTVRDWENTTR